MGYVDIPLLLLSTAIVAAGQTFWSAQSRKRRAFAAISQRNFYFIKLQKDCQKMTADVNNEIEELEVENDNIRRKLRDLGLDEDQFNDSVSKEELEKIKSLLEHKKRQVKSLDKELTEIFSKVGLDEDIALEDLAKKNKNLQCKNEALESQLGSRDKLVLPTRETDMDPEVMDFIKNEGNKYSLEQLDELYEKLLEEKVADLNCSLESYEARIKTMDYEAEHQRLDMERKMVEKLHEREKQLYLEDTKTFNELRIEYCFKIAAVREECKARSDLNDIEEKILSNRRRSIDPGSNEFEKSYQEDQENHKP